MFFPLFRSCLNLCGFLHLVKVLDGHCEHVYGFFCMVCDLFMVSVSGLL